MNKEVIKKYKAEFDYWLNGGELLFWPTDKQIWFNTTSSPIDWEVDGVYIINDEYVEFRKALAEGKTVQCCGHLPEVTSNAKILDKREYYDIQQINGAFMDVSYYRIKPEEPKFKVGDWVKVGVDGDKPNTIKQVSS